MEGIELTIQLTDKGVHVISNTKHNIAISAALSIGSIVAALAITNMALVNAGFENSNPEDGEQAKFYKENGVTPRDIIFFFLEWFHWFSEKLHEDYLLKKKCDR